MLFGKYINTYYKKYATPLIIGLLSLIAVDYTQLVIPVLYKYTVNGLNDGSVEYEGVKQIFDSDFLLTKICLPMMLIVGVMLIGRFLWRVCFIGVSIKVETDLRSRMFDHCRDLSADYYHKNKVGNLMSLFTNDLYTVQDSFGWGILMTFDALILGIMAVYRMICMDLMLTVYSMIPMAFLLLCGAILDKKFEKKWDERQAVFSELSDYSQESFAGIAVIKAFVKEAIDLHRFRKLNDRNEKVNVEFVRLAILFDISISLFVQSVICVILGYGGYLVHKGAFNAGELVEFIGYFTAVVWPVMAIAQLFEMKSRGKASLKRVGELIEAPIDMKDGKDLVEMPVIKGNISLRGLTFRYPGTERDVLKDITLDIKAGQTVGIVGRVGCGKSTLAELLLRAYPVNDGEILIDGVDVNRISMKTVRNAIGYVPQDNFLFSDTIGNNIAFAADLVNDEDIRNAAELSCVRQDIDAFPDGFDTVLGERGVTVSGGQKQRISIARALIRNAPILIMDDSVSAVDVKTEKQLLDHFAAVRRDMTTVMIAHRISTIENADLIVFMDEGRILDAGSHADLYGRCEKYRDMVDLQRLSANAEGGNV